MPMANNKVVRSGQGGGPDRATRIVDQVNREMADGWGPEFKPTDVLARADGVDVKDDDQAVRDRLTAMNEKWEPLDE